MCDRTCVGVTSGKKDRTHALRTHVLEVISQAPAHVRLHIARVRACTHLRNPYLVYIIYLLNMLNDRTLLAKPTAVYAK